MDSPREKKGNKAETVFYLRADVREAKSERALTERSGTEAAILGREEAEPRRNGGTVEEIVKGKGRGW